MARPIESRFGAYLGPTKCCCAPCVAPGAVIIIVVIAAIAVVIIAATIVRCVEIVLELMCL